ncbi:MAG: hypothetical protein M3R54_12755 [Chloroflexota bacterium]|nr:hypothetical protein [Chloroflexota bacterium]
MDWGLVEIDRLQGMRCPSCQRALGGGLMRQVEWSARRCVVVVVCPNCKAECMAILEARMQRHATRSPIDVEDVRRAHDLLSQRDWQVTELFAA